MKRAGFLLKVKQERLEEYKQHHEAVWPEMSKEEVNARWQDLMAPFFENLSGAHADQSMVELEEVFHLD